MQYKVSVVVPIYNTGKYLEKCINSIRNQTYKNLEIILIDDGSTDDSKIICEKYSKVDSRIKFFSKENSGVSSTRNVGIDIATGQYILFVDSDDFIEIEMIEIMLDDIKNYNAEFSVCEYRNLKSRIHLLDKNDMMISVFETNGIQGYLCNKMYKTNIIKENN